MLTLLDFSVSLDFLTTPLAFRPGVWTPSPCSIGSVVLHLSLMTMEPSVQLSVINSFIYLLHDRSQLGFALASVWGQAQRAGRQAGSLSQKSGPQTLPGWLPILPVRLAQYPLLPLPEPSVSRREGTGNLGNRASSLPGESHMSPGTCPSSGRSPSGSLDKAQDSCLAFIRSSPHSRLRPSS